MLITGALSLFLWHRVVPVPAPGVAREYAFQRQVTALYYAMLLQSLDAVLRAGRRIAAFVAQQGRNAQLVNTYYPDERITE